MIYEKVMSRRSIRKYASTKVPRSILTRCVDAARLSPCAANIQQLKFLVVDSPDLLKKVFGVTRWARYVPTHKPSENEMPRAYIILLLDRNASINAEVHPPVMIDAGIAAMSISIVAYDEGLGSCILSLGNQEELRKILDLPAGLEVVLAIALGYASEKPMTDRLHDGDIRYWLDERGVLHVPKRELKDITIWNRFETRS